jgi:hypothetical protein
VLPPHGLLHLDAIQPTEQLASFSSRVTWSAAFAVVLAAAILDGVGDFMMRFLTGATTPPSMSPC